MTHTFPENITSFFKGKFIAQPAVIAGKLSAIKAYLFDWDGVFNDAFKNENGSSPFNEIDSMGVNLLRFSHFLQKGSNPFVAIISGEKNKASFTLSQRENFHSVYYKIRHKAEALHHFCRQYHLQPEEIAFVFDDVLDLSVAQAVGLRIMVAHPATALLADYCIQNKLADYITHCDGHQQAVRETADMLIALSGKYEETIKHRVDFSETYQRYLSERNAITAAFFTADTNNNIQPASV